MNYTDKDVTFYLVVYRDFNRAAWCLGNIRRHFPDVRIVVDVDGDDDPAWKTLTVTHRAEVYYGTRLFLAQCGGQIVKRAFLHHAADPDKRRWLLRIDTDTEIRRRFTELPDFDYFGHFEEWRNFVQGGCIGLTREICIRALANGYLDSHDLVNPATWQGGIKETANERLQHGLLSFDWLLNWVMCRLKVQAHNFPEIRSTWKTPIPPEVDCAVAHPCKDIPVDRPI